MQRGDALVLIFVYVKSPLIPICWAEPQEDDKIGRSFAPTNSLHVQLIRRNPCGAPILLALRAYNQRRTLALYVLYPSPNRASR
jgi:hypothetical protein